MLTYQEYEKHVFDWLMAKHESDPNFTFTVRQSAVKGAEMDYFIGTEKSNYFATTFWTLPISFPGSSQDCINLIFQLSKAGYSYYFEFNQTQTPHDRQNQSALNVVRALKEPLGKKFNFRRAVQEANKLYTIQIAPLTKDYEHLNSMLLDIERQLAEIIHLTDIEIEKEKTSNPEFKANRVSQSEFGSLIDRLNKRLEKYKLIQNETSGRFEDTSIKQHGIPKNQILYGPPGTGKTYNTIDTALKIIGGHEVNTLDWSDRKAVKDLYQKKVDEGQIVFTTFHQSMNYEDFVEGIKPEIEENKDGERTVVYEIKDGIFKLLCTKARVIPIEEEDNKPYQFDDAWNELLFEVQKRQAEAADFVLDTLTTKKGLRITEITNNGNLRLKSIDSRHSGLEYTVSYQRLKKLRQGINELSDVENIDKEFRAVIGGMNSTAYWATLNYVNNLMKQSNQPKLPDSDSVKAQPHVLIVDEINRGNVSAIFGELITLIEESKRLGADEALEITLPYSKLKFGVPENVYIIGTMNTADRSVESLDTALRRRFSFTEMLPKADMLSPERMVYDLWMKHAKVEWDDLDWLSDEENLYRLLGSEKLRQLDLDEKKELSSQLDRGDVNETVFKQFFEENTLNLQRTLDIINIRLEKLLSRDHTIGHSFFLGITTAKDLYHTFYNKIIPLLQEYFFGDYGKIGLVLGSSFITEVKNEASDIFAKFEYEDRDLLLEKKVYRINNFEMDEQGFLKAIRSI